MSRSSKLSVIAIVAFVVAFAVPTVASAHRRPGPPPPPKVSAEIGCAVKPGSQTMTIVNQMWVSGSVQITCSIENLSGTQLMGVAVTVPELGYTGPVGTIAANTNASIGFGFTYFHGITYHFVLSAPGINSVTTSLTL